ncbi:MAG TPA: hypothetical protein VJN88_03970 [Ktedonobacterales bacterium]|nr:hypothetical protein [Ktedonobacterales bacterium]
MGAELIEHHAAPAPNSIRPAVVSISWLDPVTSAAATDITRSLAVAHPEAVAVILFGSVARHEQRPLDDPKPSDLDLLLLIDPTVVNPDGGALTRDQELALHHTIGEADYKGQSPREIKFVFVYRDLARWDDLFIENVARDGILLWSRGPLPERLAPVAARAIPTPDTTSLR